MQTFLEATQKFYSADLKAVDFIGAPEESRAQINSWVEQQTESEKVTAVDSATQASDGVL